MHNYLTAIILIRTLSDIAFKTGVHKLHFHKKADVLPNLRKMILSPYVLLGLALAAANMLAWSLSLSHFDLHYAYPFTSISYILIMLCGKFFFNEHLDKTKIFGIFLISIGVLFLILGAA